MPTDERLPSIRALVDALKGMGHADLGEKAWERIRKLSASLSENGREEIMAKIAINGKIKGRKLG